MESLVKNMEILATISNFPKNYGHNFFLANKSLVPQVADADLGKSRAILSRNIPQIYANTILKELDQNPGEPKETKLVGVRNCYSLELREEEGHAPKQGRSHLARGVS